MNRIVWKYGGIGGAVLGGTLFLTLPFADEIGFEYGAFVGYASMVVAFSIVYFGIRSYRDTVGGGAVTFGRALLVGLAITAVITACYVVAWEIVFFGFAPDFMEKYAAYALEQARAQGATEAEIAQQSKEMAEFFVMYRNPLFNAAITALEPLPVGLVFAFVSAGLTSFRGSATPAHAA